MSSRAKSSSAIFKFLVSTFSMASVEVGRAHSSAAEAAAVVSVWVTFMVELCCFLFIILVELWVVRESRADRGVQKKTSSVLGVPVEALVEFSPFVPVLFHFPLLRNLRKVTVTSNANGILRCYQSITIDARRSTMS